MNAIEFVNSYKRSDVHHTLLFWHGPFSQWWYSPFEINGIEYNCAEQYMMAQKARMFGDIETEEQIMICSGEYINQKDFNQYPRQQQKFGRRVKRFDKQAWDMVANDFILHASLAKFTQDKALLASLLSTEGYTLVEASPYDKIWGIGISDKTDDAFDPLKWKGTNRLGFILTRARQYLTTVL